MRRASARSENVTGDPKCAEMAERGDCDSGPGWMIMHCPISCDRCAMLDPKVRCPRENLEMDSEPHWKAGDLDAMFRRASTAEEFVQFEPVVLSSPTTERDDGIEKPPWILRFDNFVTPEEAAALIGQVSDGFESSTEVGATDEHGETQKVASTGRTSQNAWCGPACENNDRVKNITQRIFDVTQVPRVNYESFQVLKYGINQKYDTHHDNGNNEMRLPCGPRILTFFLYLSDVDEGGTTDFVDLGISVSPKLGRAVLWPSVLDEDPTRNDWRTRHRAAPVLRGTKYAANHWIHLFNYKIPNLWGCTGSFS